jgi:hypothetical protein
MAVTSEGRYSAWSYCVAILAFGTIATVFLFPLWAAFATLVGIDRIEPGYDPWPLFWIPVRVVAALWAALGCLYLALRRRAI